MADFKTHITVSSVLGVGYGCGGYFLYQIPVEQCMLAGGLCGLAGMLPDLDSDSGVPVRETLALAAAVTPLLMLDRLQHLGLTHAGMAVAAGVIYLLVRFGVGAIFKRYTVHRGMWHSVPAALIAGLLTFVLCGCQDFSMQLFKSAAVMLGFMSHLVLDEFWSIKWGWTGPRFKKSFGTAVKFWNGDLLANISTYGKLALLAAYVFLGDAWLMEHLPHQQQQRWQTAREWVADLVDRPYGRLVDRPNTVR